MANRKRLKFEEIKRFSYLRHIPNFNKTDGEFEEYCYLAKKVGLATPNRNSKERPLHEKVSKQ